MACVPNKALSTTKCVVGGSWFCRHPAALSRKIWAGLYNISMIDEEGNVIQDPRWVCPAPQCRSLAPQLPRPCLRRSADVSHNLAAALTQNLPH